APDRRRRGPSPAGPILGSESLLECRAHEEAPPLKTRRARQGASAVASDQLADGAVRGDLPPPLRGRTRRSWGAVRWDEPAEPTRECWRKDVARVLDTVEAVCTAAARRAPAAA